MPLIFSYGSLQQRDVQLSTFGRPLTGTKDELIGFELSSVKINDGQVAVNLGKTHHANVIFNGRNGSRVGGTVFEISDAELAMVDEYERRDNYARVAATVVSGKTVWVYAFIRTLPGVS